MAGRRPDGLGRRRRGQGGLRYSERGDGRRLGVEAQAHAQRLAAQTDAEAHRIKTEAEVHALREQEQAAQALGLLQSNDMGAVDAAIDALIAANPQALIDYKGGKKQARGSLIGMMMKSGKGLNAKVVGERLDERLGIG